jgi:hypothetical protein
MRKKITWIKPNHYPNCVTKKKPQHELMFLSVVWGGLTHLLSIVCINIDPHLVAQEFNNPVEQKDATKNNKIK